MPIDPWEDWNDFRRAVRWTIEKEVGPSSKELEKALNRAVAEIIMLRELLNASWVELDEALNYAAAEIIALGGKK